MYDTLRKFLSLHHRLALPGIGYFKVNDVPAQINFTERCINAPSTKIIFTNEHPLAEKPFYDFLIDELNVDEVEAIRQFSDFTSALRNKLQLPQCR